MSLLGNSLLSVSREDGPMDPAPSTSDTLLDVKGAAELLNVPESWIYQHVRSRAEEKLPHFKLGKYIRFSTKALVRWLEMHHFNNESTSSVGQVSFARERRDHGLGRDGR